ncbi:MAG: hypothetical protein ACI9FJ_002698 [Alteromonadaceae bacterium]|jgi:hypothetical protein
MPNEENVHYFAQLMTFRGGRWLVSNMLGNAYDKPTHRTITPLCRPTVICGTVVRGSERPLQGPQTAASNQITSGRELTVQQFEYC